MSKLLGIKVSSSSASFAGQASTCVTVTVHGKGGKYCVTKQGILSYSGSSSDYFQLTKYSSKPPASLFTLPTGATTVTAARGRFHPVATQWRPVAGERRPAWGGLRPPLRGAGRLRHGYARRGGAGGLVGPGSVLDAGLWHRPGGHRAQPARPSRRRGRRRRGHARGSRGKAPDLAWVHGDLADPTLDFGRTFDVVVMAGNVLIFVPPGREGDVVANVARWLSPGGRLVTGYSLRPDGFGPRRHDAAGRPCRPRVRGPLVDLGPAARRARDGMPWPCTGDRPEASLAPPRNGDSNSWATLVH